MLYSQINKTEIHKAIEGKIAKLVGFVFDEKSWKISDFILSYGIGKKKSKTIDAGLVKKIDTDKNRIDMPEEFETGEVPEGSKSGSFLSGDLLGMKVVSSDGEKVGKITDLDIPEQFEDWRIWKLIIGTKGMKKRRMRVSPEDIDGVDRTVVLKKSYEELYPSEEEDGKNE